MLQNISKDICECYRRADECRELAGTTTRQSTKADYLGMEQRWLALARSYEFAERLSGFNEEFKARYRRPRE
jgi:hypothetical protein